MKIEIEHEGSCLGATGGTGRLIVRDAHHEHLIDVRTGKVVEFRTAELAKLIRAAAAELGYELLDYRLKVFGAPAAASRADHELR